MPMRKPMLGTYIAWTRINRLFRCTYSSLARLKRSISKGSWRYARTTRTPDNVSWLALPCGLVRDVGAIVRVSVRTVSDGRHDRAVRSPVTAQRVGDQSHGLTLLAL